MCEEGLNKTIGCFSFIYSSIQTFVILSAERRVFNQRSFNFCILSRLGTDSQQS